MVASVPAVGSGSSHRRKATSHWFRETHIFVVGFSPLHCLVDFVVLRECLTLDLREFDHGDARVEREVYLGILMTPSE